MKKITLVLVLAILPFFGFSQSLFDKYENMENVGSVVINKSLINLMSSVHVDGVDKETEDFIEMAKSLNSLKVFITEDKATAKDMGVSVKKYLRTAKLEELMRVKDKDVNVKFYIREGKTPDHVKELLMFVTDMGNLDINVDGRKFETVLLSITGDIDLSKISTLTNKMNLPKELNKVNKEE